MNSKPTIPVRVVRRFSASPERVFDAFLDVAKVRQWFGPGLGEMVRLDIDARVGGTFFFTQRRNGEDVEHTGEYLEIDRPRRLVFTWALPQHSPDRDRVSIDIVPLGSGCELALTHEIHPEWAEYADRTKAGWTTMIEVIAKLVG